MSDSFAEEVTVTPVAIGDIGVDLFDPGPDNTADARSAYTNIQVVMSDGTVHVRRFNLVDHFSSTVINQLVSFVTSIRTKAVAEILPPAP